MLAGNNPDSFRHATPLEYPDRVYRLTIENIPHFGSKAVTIPKDLEENKKWRRKWIERVNESQPARAFLYHAMRTGSPEACILWLNLFGWTLKQRQITVEGHERGVAGDAVNVPFITWPCQDEAIRTLHRAITQGHDLVIDKSRQMGATWLIASVFTYLVLFVKRMNFIVMSQREELVDNPADPFAIMQKLDHLIGMQPKWLIPTLDRARLRISFPDNKSTIMGRSTSSAQGRGGAVNAMLMDEMSQVDNAEPIWVGFSQSTSCRIGNATPNGPVFYSQLVMSGHIEVLRMPWWNHPEKGRGRELAQDPATGEVYITSPWYAQQVAKEGGDRKSKAIAQELDMDHMASGRMVFDAGVLSRHLHTTVRPALHVGRLVYADEQLMDQSLLEHDMSLWSFADDDRGNLHLWCDLIDGRPPQNRAYAIGADISWGMGASNSVASVIDLDSGEKVAELVDPNLNPDDFARACVALGHWFKGPYTAALLAPEANGPGGAFIKRCRRLGYPWLYRHQDEAKIKNQSDAVYGWVSNRQRKIDILGELRTAYARDEFLNPSRPALEEAMSYVVYDSGGVGPGRMEAEPEGARMAHGDRVIADALANACRRWVAKSRPAVAPPPKGSVAYRMQQAKKKQRAW